MGVSQLEAGFLSRQASAEELSSALRHQLNTVEVNFTFRQLIKETTAQKWIAETPADFRFG